MRKWEGWWWTSGQFPAVFVATKRARAKHCYKKLANYASYQGYHKMAHVTVLSHGCPCCRWLAYWLLTLSHPHTGATLLINSCTYCILRWPSVNFEGRTQLPLNGRRIHVPALICMWTRCYSQYIYTEARQTTTILNSWTLVVAQPFHGARLFIISCWYTATQRIYFLSTPAAPYTQWADQTQTVGQILLDLICCLTNELLALGACGRGDPWSHPRPFL